MNIKEAKQEIKNTLLAYHKKDAKGRYVYPTVRQRPILMIGPPGIGKTAIMTQIAQECGIGLVSYTITHHTRQSAIGLPKIVSRNYDGKEMSVTEYTLSEIVASVYDCMEKTGKREGILFIDEINCASETLAPVMLQFLQNKTFGSHRIPEGWMIVAAGNPPEYNKSVREFDMVTLDRVRKIELEENLEAWMSYAWEHQIHGAVLSYLNVRKEHFYVLEQVRGERQFVTARGWEDLSELLKSYEELGITITEKSIGQFLQQKKVSREFAAYYQLFHAYGTDYGNQEVLEGTLSKERFQEIRKMAEKSGFDEKITVAGLLADSLNSGLEREETAENRNTLLENWLGKLCTTPSEKGMEEALRVLAEEKSAALKVREEMELIGSTQVRLEETALDRIESYRLILKKEHLDSVKTQSEAKQRIRQLFEEEVQQQRELQEEIQKKLRRAFRFLAELYGQGQELLLFVTLLTRNRRAMKFISAHGCPEFFQYSEQLLTVRAEQSLQEACAELLEASEEQTN